ncbi:MAG: hypothetical protein ACYS8W_04460 [Planctomycetota bacterium]|jgi:hypothetical protein
MKRFAVTTVITSILAIIMAFPGCGKNDSSADTILTGTASGMGTITDTGTGSNSNTATGSGGGGADPLAFVPEVLDANTSDTVYFQVTGGVPPYQVGWRSASDCRSYPDYTQAQGTVDPNTGQGWYVVGTIGSVTDRLCAIDSADGETYLTINVNAAPGTGTGTGTGSTGTGTGTTGTGTGTTSTGTGTSGTGTGTGGTGTGSGTGTTGTGTEKPPQLFCAVGQFASGHVTTNAGTTLHDGEIIQGTSKYGFVKIDLSNVDPSARAVTAYLKFYINKPGPVSMGIHRSYKDPQGSDKYLETGATLLGKPNPPPVSTTFSFSVKNPLNNALQSGSTFITFLFKPC